MFFTRVARVLAFLIIAVGVIETAVGFYIASQPEEMRAGLLFPFGSSGRSPGQLIDRGLRAIFIAIALGTLAEISFSVQDRRDRISAEKS